jgi:hypothetical protein
VHSPARVTTHLLAALLAVGAAAAVLAGCSTSTDYPAVLATPAARSDQTMTPDEVKQATDALISERNRLAGGESSQQRTQASVPARRGSSRQKTQASAQADSVSNQEKTQASAPAGGTGTAGNAQ